jgi:hypothetical protein
MFLSNEKDNVGSSPTERTTNGHDQVGKADHTLFFIIDILPAFSYTFRIVGKANFRLCYEKKALCKQRLFCAQAHTGAIPYSAGCI